MAETTTSPEKPTDPNPQKPDPDAPISRPDPDPLNPNPTLLPPSQPPLLQLPLNFRPVAPPIPIPAPPQFSPLPGFVPQSNVVQPPGVPPVPGSVPGPIPGTRPGPGGLVYAQLPNQRPPYMQMPNGYLPLHPPVLSSC